jgi:dTDP-4-dehydrorhamnose 3,5-epimerase
VFHYFHEGLELQQAGITIPAVQAHASRYGPLHTVRGLHFQRPPQAQTKVVRVSRGRIFDVVVDLRKSSPTRGRHIAITLDARDWQRLVIPPGFAHGFCTLEPDCEVEFTLSARNEKVLLGGLRWNDPQLGIAWPCGPTPGFLMPVDQDWPLLAALESPFE